MLDYYIRFDDPDTGISFCVVTLICFFLLFMGMYKLREEYHKRSFIFIVCGILVNLWIFYQWYINQCGSNYGCH